MRAKVLARDPILCPRGTWALPYGEFGTSDSDLGHRPDGSVTLEQVAQGANVKIRYIYDFGDDWEHEILVEKVLDGNPGVPALPWCTGGRRAAPPEDCGGIWGHADLLDALDDPTRADHKEKLEWLGLADLSEFDPAAFDIADCERGADPRALTWPCGGRLWTGRGGRKRRDPIIRQARDNIGRSGDDT